MSSVMKPQSVPSRISVVLVEETEVWGAECLASVPVDKAVRLLAGATCPSSGTCCDAGAMMSGAVGTLSPSISGSVGPVGHVGTLSPPDSVSVGPVGPFGTLSPSDSDSVGPVGPYGTLSPSDSDSVGPVGPYGTLSPSDSDSVGPVGPYGTLSPSDSDSVGPVGLCGTLSPSDSDPVGPVGPHGMLSPSDSDSVGPVGPDGTLSSSDLAGILFPVGPVGPVGTLSLSDLESDGPVGPVWRLSPFDHVDRLSLFAPPVGEMSSVDPARGPPGGLIPMIWTEFTDRKDPVITQLPADGPVGDNRDVVDMDVSVDICPVAPDASDSRAVVAMVGLDMVRRREEAPMACGVGYSQRV